MVTMVISNRKFVIQKTPQTSECRSSILTENQCQADECNELYAMLEFLYQPVSHD